MKDNSILDFKRRELLKKTGMIACGLTLTGLSRTSRAVTDYVTDQNTIGSPDNPVRINFNENPLGMSLKAQEAARISVSRANRYAKDEIVALRRKLADRYHLSEQMVLLTAGSSEGIRAAVESCASPNTQLVIPTLTYGDGEHFAKIAGMKVTHVAMLDGWQSDIDGLRQATEKFKGHSLVYLVNPNNPTGRITPASQIEPWIRGAAENVTFVVDEAYAEFVNDQAFNSVAPLIAEGARNVILLKTFSKIYAMAGMRVGYALAHADVITRLADHVAGEKISFCGVEAARVSLDDQAFVAYSKKSNDTSRQIFLQVLGELNLTSLPSEGNFVFFQPGIPLADFQDHMKREGILVGRSFPPAVEWCRISLGTPQEMTYVAKVMRDFRSRKII